MNKKINLFANIKTFIDFKRYIFRIGANYLDENFESNTRLETKKCYGKGLALT